MKRVLDIGNCGPDHAAIRETIERHFDAVVDQADRFDDARSALESTDYALVLVNRKLDCDYSDGADVIRRIKSEASWASLPVMMVTNFPEHQQAAVALGAVQGFGKLALDDRATLDLLGAYLS